MSIIDQGAWDLWSTPFLGQCLGAILGAIEPISNVGGRRGQSRSVSSKRGDELGQRVSDQARIRRVCRST